MAWTAPTERVAGQLVTASIWNTDVVANLIALHTTPTVTGRVASTGTITAGSGFSVSKGATGVYTITFTNAFAGAAGVAATTTSAGFVAQAFGSNSTTAIIHTVSAATTPVAADVAFLFVAYDIF